jgi:hypothetical protein
MTAWPARESKDFLEDALPGLHLRFELRLDLKDAKFRTLDDEKIKQKFISEPPTLTLRKVPAKFSCPDSFV